jgi:hypothetical protein
MYNYIFYGVLFHINLKVLPLCKCRLVFSLRSPLCISEAYRGFPDRMVTVFRLRAKLNERRFFSVPQYVFVAYFSIRQMDNFTYTCCNT